VDLDNRIYTNHYEQMIQDVHFLSYHLKLGGDYIESLTWRRRKEMIGYHVAVLEEQQKKK